MTLIAAEKEQPIIRSLLFLAIAQISRGNGIINKKAKINEETGFTIKKPKLYIIPCHSLKPCVLYLRTRFITNIKIMRIEM
jgi:hypothetical protein